MDGIIKLKIKFIKWEEKDFHLYMHLKTFLGSNDEDIKKSVQKWFMSQVTEFYDPGIILVLRYDKCLLSCFGVFYVKNYITKILKLFS